MGTDMHLNATASVHKFLTAVLLVCVSMQVGLMGTTDAHVGALANLHRPALTHGPLTAELVLQIHQLLDSLINQASEAPSRLPSSLKAFWLIVV
jgi:hypothetical protein